MTGLVNWCTDRARMVLGFVVISITAGLFSYVSLPREGAPNIDVPVLYVSTPLPGVSAADSERLLIKPLETRLRSVDSLKEMTGIASLGHAGVLLEFEQDWDKQSVMFDVRDEVDRAKVEFPEAAEEPTINEVNLSEFPVLVVSLSGEVPERTLLRLAKDLQRDLEADDRILEADLTGHREEMLEILIDPLKMESYNVTAAELLAVIERNNQLVAAGSIESETAAFSVSVPGAFETASEVCALPVKVNGDRVVRLCDVAEGRRTFADAEGTARYNGETSISLQISKRLGENIIATVEGARAIVDAAVAKWPEPLQQAVQVDLSMDESVPVNSMVEQLESAVFTAILLVMIVVLAALGFRSAMLVGIAIPSSFLLSFALMNVVGLPINNMVMFGLILAVGMLVDGAIVVVEYADKEISAGKGPMRAYTAAAKRMFWPIVASTATTLCAFVPMLFWPGVPGQFMSLLPTTLIFVLSASLIVALVFLPVLGGLSGRVARSLERLSPFKARPRKLRDPSKRALFGKFVAMIVMNPMGPFIAIGAAIVVMMMSFGAFMQNGKGTEFFVETDPERAIVFVRARGNLSLIEADRLVRDVEARVREVESIESIFAFSGAGGLRGAPGQEAPQDTIGQIQIELAPWRERGSGKEVLTDIRNRTKDMPGVFIEVVEQKDGPTQGKPVQLELRSNNWQSLHDAAEIARAKFESTRGLMNVDDSRPLPGIDWEITVDRATAGRFGADVATVGPLVQLVTRGALLGTYRPEDSDDELEIRMRFPEGDRLLSTLDQLKVPTNQGQVPLSNFIKREPVHQLAEINRRDTERFFLVRADIDYTVEGATDVGMIEELEDWIAAEDPFPRNVAARFTGDRQEQAETMDFLVVAFSVALGLMFVILLAQFNSLYNSALVLSAVVMSVAGVLIGMLVMDQKFSIIMTGTGVVALAGIVVNNNIVLIDTFQQLAKQMRPLDAIVRTAEERIRPVLLTTITTMAGLMPMMFATSLDFATGTISQNAPTALWWVQLATAVVFGLGIATVLTLVVTPAALAVRVWIERFLGASLRQVAFGFLSRSARARVRADRDLNRAMRKESPGELIFDADNWPGLPAPPKQIPGPAE
ncbi:MAG: efflux RND transporter permease subunit [Pseudomonadota bacterium]